MYKIKYLCTTFADVVVVSHRLPDLFKFSYVQVDAEVQGCVISFTARCIRARTFFVLSWISKKFCAPLQVHFTICDILYWDKKEVVWQLSEVPACIYFLRCSAKVVYKSYALRVFFCCVVHGNSSTVLNKNILLVDAVVIYFVPIRKHLGWEIIFF